jgi:hypothetical protein
MKREASPFHYDSLLAADAADWGSFQDEGGPPQASCRCRCGEARVAQRAVVGI